MVSLSILQVAQLWQRDRVTEVCCAYIRKVHCAVVGSCYTSGRPCTEHVYVANSAFFKGGAWFWPNISQERGRRPPTTVGVRKLEWLITLSCGIRISAVHHLVLSQYSHLTDRWTDGQNCESNTVHCITCSHTVKTACNQELSYCRDSICHPP